MEVSEFLQTYQKEVYDVSLSEFKILSTIRYDPSISKAFPSSADEVVSDNFFLLPEHVERIRFTSAFFVDNYKSAEGGKATKIPDLSNSSLFKYLKQALVASELPITNPYKVRLLISMDGKMDVEFHPTAIREDLFDGFNVAPTWTVYVDSERVLPSPFTSFKTTYRKVYSEARARALTGAPNEEVILINSSKEAMEGSITNFALRAKDGQWVTPKLTSGCLCGVMRHFLLLKNMILEGTVETLDLEDGAEVLLFNGVMGVVKGKLVFQSV